MLSSWFSSHRAVVAANFRDLPDATAADVAVDVVDMLSASTTLHSNAIFLDEALRMLRDPLRTDDSGSALHNPRLHVTLAQALLQRGLPLSILDKVSFRHCYSC